MIFSQINSTSKSIALTTFLILVTLGCTSLPSAGNVEQPPVTPTDNSSQSNPTIESTLSLAPTQPEETIPTHMPTSTPETQVSNQTPVETPITPESDDLINDAFEPLVSSDTTFPESIVKILRPGNLSRVTSPFSLVANLEPGPRDQVEVELVGEDGRLLMYKIVQITVLPGYTTGNLVTELDFEIEGVAEAGRLSVSARDEFGRPKSLASVDLILLSNGSTKLNPYGDLRDNLVIQQPNSNVIIYGDTLFITGLAHTREYHPLEISIIDELGTIISTGQAAVIDSEDPEIKLFIGEIKYQVNQATWIRLIVNLPGERIPGIANTSSIVLVISP